MKSIRRTVGPFTASLGVMLAALATLGPLGSTPAAAQAYPSKPVRIVVPFAAGGGNDVVARLLATRLTQKWGQPVLVENRAGAGGNIGIAYVAKAAPDGHTILTVTNSFMINPSLYPNPGYDPIKDFEPVTMTAHSPNALVVHPSVPAKNVKELVDLLRANPDKYSVASAGTGTTSQLSIELFKQTLGLNLTNIPYNGAAPATLSVVAGTTPMTILVLPTAAPHIKSGQLRALAVTSSTRAPTFPEVPTMAEAGIAGQETLTVQGVFLPAGTPRAIINKVNEDIIALLQDPDIRQRISGVGFDVAGTTPEAFRAQVQEEVTRWARVIKAANIKIE